MNFTDQDVRKSFDGVDLRQKSVDDANGVRGFVGRGVSSGGKTFDLVDQNADERARVLDHFLDLLEPEEQKIYSSGIQRSLRNYKMFWFWTL